MLLCLATYQKQMSFTVLCVQSDSPYLADGVAMFFA